MKIVSSGKGIHSPEFHKKKRREQTVRLVVALLFVVVFVAIPIYLLKTKRFLISSVEVRGNSVTKTEEIEQIIKDKIIGNYLWIFPRSNDLLYPKGEIKNTLFQNIPRLSAITVSLSNPNLISISVEERKPFALYCVDTLNLNNPTGCFFLDKTGYIFSEAPAISGGVYFVYTNEPVFDLPLRQSLLNPNRFSEVSSFVGSLSSIGLSPKVFIDKGDEFNLVLPNGATVMWKSSANLDTIHSDLESFLSDPNFIKENNALQRILYIDLRFGNKVFYKFK